MKSIELFGVKPTKVGNQDGGRKHNPQFCSPPRRDASPGWQLLPAVNQGLAEGSALDALLFEEQLLYGLALYTHMHDDNKHHIQELQRWNMVKILV